MDEWGTLASTVIDQRRDDRLNRWYASNVDVYSREMRMKIDAM